LHIEGYIIYNHELLEAILKKASRAGLKIALDLASYNVVEDNLEFLRKMVTAYVDIVFANEEEARAYTGQEDPLEALRMLSETTELAIVKLGHQGSFISYNGMIHKIPAVLSKVVDTTGAGDVYAAGFLYGFFNDFGIENAGYLGSLMASKVIENYGAKISEQAYDLIKEEVAGLRSV